MPAVDYDYNYRKSNSRNQGVARKATSNSRSSNLSAQSKVATNKAKVAQTNRVKVNTNNNKLRKQNHADIDVPIVVKKKIELQKPEEMKLKKPKVDVKNKKKTESAKKSIIATVIGFGALFIICMRYAQINELTHKLNSVEKNLANVVSLNQQLSAEVDSKTDLSYIEKYAKYQLGMQKPDEKQIVRIPYDKQDKISTPIVIEEEAEPNLFEKIIRDLRNLVD